MQTHVSLNVTLSSEENKIKMAPTWITEKEADGQERRQNHVLLIF